MVPGVSGGRGAWNSGMDPIAGGVAPDVPLSAVFDVALRAENKFIDVVGLIDVKLQRLRRSGVGDIEIQVVSEIFDGIVAAELLPPERVRVRRAAGKIELG